MTPVDKDDIEDADLARRLAALPQPEPSAELDASIFAQIEKDLAPGPAAANDPAAEAPRPKPKHRYRAPLAFAASLAGIAILFPVWRSYQQQNQLHDLQPVEVRIVPEGAPAALPSPMISQDKADVPAEKKRESAIVAAKPAPPMLEMPVPQNVEAPPIAAAPPPPVPAAEIDELEPAPKAAARASDAVSPKDWLQTIERMLEAGDTEAAAAQWKRFRKAHPDYPVPDSLANRLKTLE